MKLPIVTVRDFRRRVPSPRDGLLVLAGGLIVLSGFGIISLMRSNPRPPVPLEPTSYSVSIPWLPATVKNWEEAIIAKSRVYKVDPELVAIIMTLESGGYTRADSGQAQGLMQVTPPTAGDIAMKFLKKPVTSYDVWEPQTNIEFGVAYLAYLRDQFGATSQGPSWNETVELVAAGYNGGPGAANSLEQGQGLRDTQTLSYSRDVLNMWRERHSDASPTYERWLERGGSILIDKAQAEL